jgi:hypothetical protein
LWQAIARTTQKYATQKHLWFSETESERDAPLSRPYLILTVWNIGCLLFALWFFNTPAGKTFLADRAFVGYPLLEPLPTTAYVVAMGGFIIMFRVAERRDADRMMVQLLLVVALGACYWYWSSASLLLMYCFLLTSMIGGRYGPWSWRWFVAELSACEPRRVHRRNRSRTSS